MPNAEPIPGAGPSRPLGPTPERDLGTVLRQFAHDLKGQLGSISLWFYLLESATGDPERARAIDELKATFNGLDRAATDLGDASHALLDDAGGAGHETVDLAAVVAAATAAATLAGRGRGITFESVLPPLPWPDARGNPNELVKAIGRVLYWSVKNAASGARVALEVRIDDTFTRLRVPAPGLSPGVVPDLRTLLADVVAGSKEAGLALPLARETLRRHGGELETTRDHLLEARIPVTRINPGQTPR